MRASQLPTEFGTEVYFMVEKIEVRVIVSDFREQWGRVDWLISAVGVSGKQWVSENRIRPIPGTEYHRRCNGDGAGLARLEFAMRRLGGAL